MRSRTSCFNPTLYRKNLTRFAPAWGLYTLCLILGIGLIYTNGGTAKFYHFAPNLGEVIQIMGGINLIYAALVAQLLFGDLYNSRMCYALHAMPVRRESLFWTNIASGITFSVVPSALMCLLTLPLLANSSFNKAMLIPAYVFAGVNLEFICFFGMAVLCAMLVGNRLSMVLVYGLFNFGAAIAYWLVDTLYTPMLYGVITPDALMETLTPVARFTEEPYLEMTPWYEISEKFNGDITKAVNLSYNVTDKWSELAIWAVVGIAFMILALVLYKKRDLECAGDAMAFKILEPVFQVLGAVVAAAAAEFFLSNFLGFAVSQGNYHYIFLAAGLLVGWFACRMLIERGTRVFRLRNWYGLGALTGVLVLSLVLTHFDVLGIATWMPKAEKVKSVEFYCNYSDRVTLEDREDIEKILKIQEIALEDRLEQAGPYVKAWDGSWVYNIDSNSDFIAQEQDEITECIYAVPVQILYTLESGKEVNRRYVVWADNEAGQIAEGYSTTWEAITGRYNRDGNFDRLERVLSTLERIYISCGVGEVSGDEVSRAIAEELIAAVKADCEAGNMAQSHYFHKGTFLVPEEQWEENDKYGYPNIVPDIYVSLQGEDYSWSINIYADSENCINWLEEHGWMKYTVQEQNYHYN